MSRALLPTYGAHTIFSRSAPTHARTEVLRAGDLYYLPPGHTGFVEEDFECIEFSPPAAHEQVLDVVKRNAAMAQTAPA